MKAESLFLDQFCESFKNLAGDEEMVPLSEEVEQIRSGDVYPNYRMIPYDTLKKLDPETLLVIFHFSKNGYERHLAAKQLKQREWRYSKKFSIWFKRNKPPREQTDTYEKGEYQIFDHEEKLTIKKSPEMIVEYKDLEDEK